MKEQPICVSCSVLFEEHNDEYFVGLCLEGFVAMVWLASLLEVAMVRSTFVSSLAHFTMLHSPAAMKAKHARAFRRGAACRVRVMPPCI